jgi:hypothetical protein
MLWNECSLLNSEFWELSLGFRVNLGKEIPRFYEARRTQTPHGDEVR